MESSKSLRLLPRRALVKTGNVDHADWNFRPFLGFIQRSRFKLVKALMHEKRVERLLEIGYGSGIFLPELAGRADEVHGIDVHEQVDAVTAELKQHGVRAKLISGSASELPYETAYFDLLVAVSALEFVADLDAACREFARVLRPAGSLIVVTPGHSPILDLGLAVFTGASARRDFGKRREGVIPALLRSFEIQEQLTMPSVAPLGAHMYMALKLGPKAAAAAP